MTSINELLEKAVKAGATPGFSLVRIDRNGKKYFSSAGSTNRGEQPVTSKTLYDLASLTKVVGTTTRLLQLVDEGKIGFSTKLYELFPAYPNLKMTIEQVMLHCAGFLADYPNKQTFSRQKLWQYFAEFIFTERAPMVYSDLGFLLLGEVVEKLDGRNLEESYHHHIFQPLEMGQTTYFPREKALCAPSELTRERGMIQGIVHDGKAYRFGKPAGHAGLFSSAEDLTKFLIGFQEQQLFSSARWNDLMHKAENGRTYGWAIHEKAGQLFHTGFTGGLICLNLHTKESLGLLSNSTYPSRIDKRFIEVRHKICRAFFEKD